VKTGDRLTATSTEEHLGRQFARYTVRVTDRDGRQVALFHGTVFRTGEPWQV
jgi:acyl-coenzyme A thioesterase PaaI-like protein